jgi:hypothetical protein
MAYHCKLAIVAALTGIFLNTMPPAAAAQYFGQNKVQYRTFDFQVLKTEHFDIYYYPAEERAARDAARMAERWYSRLSRILSHQLSSRQPLILYASHPHFEQTNVLEGRLGEGTGGVTESLKRRIVMPVGSGPAETDHVLGHEPEYFPYRFGHAFWAYVGGRWGDSAVADTSTPPPGRARAAAATCRPEMRWPSSSRCSRYGASSLGCNPVSEGFQKHEDLEGHEDHEPFFPLIAGGFFVAS